MKTAAEYKDYEDKRSGYSAAILGSEATKIIVMAGPGTGKSYLFQQIAEKYIEDGKKNILVLSFINELVKDLVVDMHGLADVSTLHSFAAKELSFKQKIFMGLLKVIRDDYEIETSQHKDYDLILHNLDDSEKVAIAYLRARRDYYQSIDAASMVYELVKYYSDNKHKIPKYDLILIDEYQDFNLLEIELINLLSERSNILIAGDDDQSLYSFKHSMPQNIRDKYNANDYTAFELPYCSRSTEVIVDAFHDVVKKAKSEGHLTGRIEKQYLYFYCEDKDRTSERNPRIKVKLNLQQSQNAFYIDDEISKIFNLDPHFEVLVICTLRSQVSSLVAALRKKGYSNISADESPSEKAEKLVDGIRYIVEDKESNLGWRLCSEALLTNEEFIKAVIKTKGRNIAFMDAVPSATKAEIKRLRAACVKLKANDELTQDQRDLIFSKLEVSLDKLGEINAKSRIFSNKSTKAYCDTKIKITTILGSKGLSYDYVFMVNFDDKYLVPAEGINDESINKFLVALTRSKKKTHIFTSQRREPTFLSWMAPARKVF